MKKIIVSYQNNEVYSILEEDGNIIIDKIETAIGKCGIIDCCLKKEGDSATPSGEHNIIGTFGWGDLPDNQVLIEGVPHLKITGPNECFWVDDVNSKLYNNLQFSNANGRWDSAEDLFHDLYEYALILDYNINGEKGKGSAIFVHIARENLTPTQGCIAYKKDVFLDIVNRIDCDTKIVVC